MTTDNQQGKCDDPECPWFENYDDVCPCSCHSWNAGKPPKQTDWPEFARKWLADEIETPWPLNGKKVPHD